MNRPIGRLQHEYICDLSPLARRTHAQQSSMNDSLKITSSHTGVGRPTELTGRRRAQRGGTPTATPLGARVERRVGLCSKALTLAYRDLHESTSPAGNHHRSPDHETTACVTRPAIGAASLCVRTLRRDQCRQRRDANGSGACTQKAIRQANICAFEKRPQVPPTDAQRRN